MDTEKSNSACGMLLGLAAILIGSGCSQMGKPRDRIGALPFPGIFTLYSSANPDKLGEHRYERTPRIYPADESEGIIYTTRAGFIDVAHIRITTDTVRYCVDHIRVALRERKPVVALPTIEGTIFYVELHYPPLLQKNALSATDEEKITDELAIRIGQRVTFLMMTWHEVLTWYGYRTVAFIDETPSAFTWDDSISHYVAIRVTDRVLRERSKESFDDKVTAALREELKELDALSPSETDRAAYAVEGKWWAHGKPLKRQIDIGLADDVVEPWVIPGFLPASGHVETFTLPKLTDVCGHDFTSCYSVQIDPMVHMADRMRQLLPGKPALFDGDRDIHALMETMRQQMRLQYAADVNQPWPAVAVRPPADSPHLTMAPTSQRVR